MHTHKCVLLVVDVQKAIINGQLFNINKVMDNIKKLISAVRDNGVEVVYVCHDVRKIEQSED